MPAKPNQPMTIKEIEQIKLMVASGMSWNAVAGRIGRDPKTVKRYALEPKNAKKIEAMKEELADMFEDSPTE